MEHVENRNTQPEENPATPLANSLGYEDHTVCNCENNECVIPYQSDEGEDEKCEIANAVKKKYQAAKTACKKKLKRLEKDWKGTNGNPYIQKTHVCKIDVYRNQGDTEPIDTFHTESVKRFSARALAILGGAVLATVALGWLGGKKRD